MRWSASYAWLLLPAAAALVALGVLVYRNAGEHSEGFAPAASGGKLATWRDHVEIPTPILRERFPEGNFWPGQAAPFNISWLETKKDLHGLCLKERIDQHVSELGYICKGVVADRTGFPEVTAESCGDAGPRADKYHYLTLTAFVGPKTEDTGTAMTVTIVFEYRKNPNARPGAIHVEQAPFSIPEFDGPY